MPITKLNRIGSSILVVLVLLCSLVLSQSNSCAAETKPEPLIKAALVFNLSKFVSCQGEHPTNGEPYTLCIIGDDDTLPAFAELDGKVLQGSKFVVRCEPEEAELAACRIIYFCDSDADRIETLIASLGDSPVLTVSTAEDFIENGGIIQLVKVRKKFRFRINPAAAERAGLKLSSQLLKIADIASR